MKKLFKKVKKKFWKRDKEKLLKGRKKRKKERSFMKERMKYC